MRLMRFEQTITNNLHGQGHLEWRIAAYDRGSRGTEICALMVPFHSSEAPEWRIPHERTAERITGFDWTKPWASATEWLADRIARKMLSDGRTMPEIDEYLEQFGMVIPEKNNL